MRKPILFFIFLLIIRSGECRPPDSTLTNGKASYYHDDFQGLETSSGDLYDMDDFTAAHRTLPFNTFIHVTNKQNQKSVVVRINDRGPFKKSRIIDLTRSAAQKIGMVPFGVVPVRIQVLDLLDHLLINDGALMENEVWDCYGKKKTLNGITVYVWKTEFWKHAFYMASDFAVDYGLDQVVIKSVGKGDHRLYYLLVSGLTDKAAANSLVTKLKMDGCRGAKIMNEKK
ncbi:MAG: septal ring lytic transglycosylase RlpA family protein [Bacteroidetes bacterium]|nr:septal ring lytic transglycosylase RlpA family protein [Bacteroidota bacterium]